jgi:hypothetical protein
MSFTEIARAVFACFFLYVLTKPQALFLIFLTEIALTVFACFFFSHFLLKSHSLFQMFLTEIALTFFGIAYGHRFSGSSSRISIDPSVIDPDRNLSADQTSSQSTPNLNTFFRTGSKDSSNATTGTEIASTISGVFF